MRRVLVGFAVVFLAAGCGSDRGEDASGGADGPATSGTAASEDTAGGETFGTLPSPCGDGEAGALPSGGEEGDTQGITEDSITVGTVSDPASRAGPA